MPQAVPPLPVGRSNDQLVLDGAADITQPSVCKALRRGVRATEGWWVGGAIIYLVLELHCGQGRNPQSSAKLGCRGTTCGTKMRGRLEGGSSHTTCVHCPAQRRHTAPQPTPATKPPVQQPPRPYNQAARPTCKMRCRPASTSAA